MAFVYGTLITTPNGTTSIEQLTPGDTVSAWTPGGIVPKAVVFSDGTRSSSDSIVLLRFADEDLLITQDEPIVLAGNKVKNAAQLKPGDQLLKADGQTVMIDAISLMRYGRGVHAIAIDNLHRTGDHLIIANGIVCGDYLMQIMPDDSYDMPFRAEEEHKTID